ncbi:MAG: FKBP-type peptidyl-prolyl cis-trans isomerase [Candidatus Staskawiczbacteria bacterium]|nr:FKBP-type peptidyl-prolyl cis-trans isomerase [Candidatus Staskawiczbacteria bacterium]
MDKKAWILILVIAIILIGGYFMFKKSPTEQTQNNNNQIINNTMEETKGLKIETLQEGSGEGAKSGELVTVNYTGTLTDGTKFDSSLNPGREPFAFTINESSVIQGWHLGFMGMKVGEKRKLTIAPELAYGPDGRPPVIPQNATLIFEVELLKIN